MADIEPTFGAFSHDAPSVTVQVSSVLGSGWLTQPYLYLDRLKLTASPDIDEAQFHYDYGTQIKPGTTTFIHREPRDIVGKFVRVEIEDTVNTPAVPILWFGILEVDSKAPHGSSNNDESGIQKITAFGLARLLERQQITTTVIEDGTSTKTIKRPLEFNTDMREHYEEHGNRSDDKIDGVYVFSNRQSGQSEWRGMDVLGYVLKHHEPKDKDDIAIGTWTIVGDPDNINWNAVGGIRQEGRTVKGVLDSVINRRRGIGYHIAFNEPSNVIEIRHFTFAEQPMLLPSGILAANANPKSIDFEKAFDISSAKITDTLTSQYHKVIVEGDWKTSTMTLRIDEASTEMSKDWTAAEETDYREAAENESDYQANTESTKQSDRNAKWRAKDSLSHVYKRFTIDPAWTQRTEDPEGLGVEYFAAPPVDEYGEVVPDRNVSAAAIAGTLTTTSATTSLTEAADDFYNEKQIEWTSGTLTGESGGITDYNGTTKLLTFSAMTGAPSAGDTFDILMATGEPLWTRGIRIQKRLTLKDRYDYSASNIDAATFIDSYAGAGEPEFLPPFVINDTSGVARVFGEAIAGTLSATEATTDLTVALDDYYSDASVGTAAWIYWTSGSLDGESGEIEDYDGATKKVTFTAMSGAPSAADEFYIDTPQKWVQVERLADNSASEEVKRSWSCSLHVLSSGPQIEVDVQSKSQHMFATADFDVDNAATTDPAQDPTKEKGLDWQDSRCTLTIKLDERAQAVNVVNAQNVGEQQRILRIRIPDARQDYVVPGTVVAIEDGELVKTTEGGFVRNDIDQLETIANAAGLWYGLLRQPLSLTYRQVRDVVTIGWLITDVGANYNETGVNSVVTSITYDMLAVSTSFSTSFAEIDFA